MRILVDMPISPRTVEFLRGLGHEVVHALEFGLGEGMTILTEDLYYAAILAVTGEIEPGVIILRVGNWTREQIESRLNQVLGELSQEFFRNSIVVVERYRIRSRRLPIHPEGSM
jgi:predicted nuclease of predicted toxin-antitoxin system